MNIVQDKPATKAELGRTRQLFRERIDQIRTLLGRHGRVSERDARRALALVVGMHEIFDAFLEYEERKAPEGR